MLCLDVYNHLFMVGPCGMPWNYSHLYCFGLSSDEAVLSPKDLFVKYGGVKIISGTITLNDVQQTCQVALRVESKDESGSLVISDFEANGDYRYKVLERP